MASRSVSPVRYGGAARRRYSKITEQMTVSDSKDQGVWRHAHTLYLIKQLEMVTRAKMEPIVRSCDLTVPRYTAMTILDSTPDISSAELARRTFVSAQAANELVGGLLERGLIDRRPSPDHRKIMLLRLTTAGRQLLSRCVPLVQEIEETMLQDFASDSASGFRFSLNAYAKALQED